MAAESFYSPTLLEGRVILVTGASGGLGGAVARALARCGARLLLTGRNLRRLKTLAEELLELGREPAEFEWLSADLVQRGAAQATVERALERFGRLDGVVHAAGTGKLGRFLATPPEVQIEQMTTNFGMALQLAHAAVEPLSAHKGAFVQLTSGLAMTVRKEAVVYGATQHALGALVQGLRVELGARGCRFSVISVGGAGVDTAFWDEAMPRVDRKGMLRPDDVASSVVHVLAAPPSIQLDEVRVRTR